MASLVDPRYLICDLELTVTALEHLFNFKHISKDDYRFLYLCTRLFVQNVRFTLDAKVNTRD